MIYQFSPHFTVALLCFSTRKFETDRFQPPSLSRPRSPLKPSTSTSINWPHQSATWNTKMTLSDKSTRLNVICFCRYHVLDCPQRILHCFATLDRPKTFYDMGFQHRILSIMNTLHRMLRTGRIQSCAFGVLDVTKVADFFDSGMHQYSLWLFIEHGRLQSSTRNKLQRGNSLVNNEAFCRRLMTRCSVPQQSSRVNKVTDF